MECIKDGTWIRTSNQLEIEQEIMAKNAIRFKLASSLPIFDRNIINQIGYFSESTKVQDLIHHGTPIKTDNPVLTSFF